MAEKNDVRCQIIEAAKKRFSHFGYAKTTMWSRLTLPRLERELDGILQLVVNGLRREKPISSAAEAAA